MSKILDSLKFHEMTITWLEGVMTQLDGGTMFGPVPKAVWSRKYPVNERNQIKLATDIIWIQYQQKNYLIDTGINVDKLTEKEIKHSGIEERVKIEASFEQAGLKREEIGVVLMTHMHADHASGLTQFVKGTYQTTFPNAEIYINTVEWDEVRYPNLRTQSTYRQENWEPIQDQVILFDKHVEVVPGIELFHTGGHSKGHSIVKLTQKGETLLHMSDIMPTHAHQNPLWVTGLDDYPMDSIAAKLKWGEIARQENAKLIFYHDAQYRMIQWSEDGNEVIDALKRS